MVYAYNIFVGKPQGKRPRERISSRCKFAPILKWLYRLDLSGLGQESVAGAWEYGNETLGFIKGTGFLSKYKRLVSC
jgi:hypothetical protein